MKKFTLFILCILLVSLQVFPTYAMIATKETKDAINEKEVLRLKKMFDISDEYEDFNFSSYTDENKTVFYSYNWNSDDVYLHITTNKNGDIINYNYSIGDKKEGSSQLKTKAEINEVVKEFLNKIDENILKNYREAEFRISAKNGYASADYVRYVNEIPVINDSISISVDLNSKRVNNYNKSHASTVFKDGSFPKKSDAISLEKAKEVLMEKEPLILSYFIVDRYNEPKSIGVYAQKDSNKPIDALSGNLVEDEIYNIANGFGGMGGMAMETASDTAEKSVDLTPVEKNEIETLKNLKTIEDAKKEVVSKLELSELKFQNYNIGKRYNSKYVYELEYGLEKNEPKISISIDAQNLEILNYYTYENLPAQKATLSREEALVIAKTFTEKVSQRLNNLDIENPIYQSSDYRTYITFPRMENSHPVLENGVSLNIDNSTKKIASYNLEFTEAKFDDISKSIEVDKALDEAVKNLEFREYYAYVKDEPKLLYTFKNNASPIIRASDGVLLNRSGEEVTESKLVYENIDKSKYKDEINYLISINIGVPNITNLKDKIKVSDFIYLLNSLDGSIPYNKEDIKSSIRYSRFENISEEDMDKNTLNKQAIRWILNSEYYFGLNNAKDVFSKDVFKDYSAIAPEDKAYYFLAYSLSLYDYEEANPEKELTHEDALHLIYNLLKF
ncbi:YcdB/YcdC domain-containing protein [Anaerosphaera multitolerans]|uniref:YcdB/YcdC repeated domain-containing protein n=1 Tax=Anaerosphaera multitolerans TaxID=2487351 RepID=A0A437S7H5_9FIRM|nr:YcdB/YcdC domain-containing protein [Anaerosphaera multitolerans]RVU55030.1 hypothetical protein EF514_03835 [Anaerosphaera multitolerans]